MHDESWKLVVIDESHYQRNDTKPRLDRAVYIPNEHTWEYVLDGLMRPRWESELYLIHDCGFEVDTALDYLESLRDDLLSK